MEDANKLIAWDYVEEFTIEQIASLIVGTDPVQLEYKPLCAKANLVLERLTSSAQTAISLFCEIYHEYSWFADIAPLVCQSAIYPDVIEPAREVDCFFYDRPNSDIRADSLGRDYVLLRFSRKEVARWLRDNQLGAIYLFDKIQNDPPADIDSATIKRLQMWVGINATCDIDTAAGFCSHAHRVLLPTEVSEPEPAEPDKPLSTKERTSLLLIIAALCKEAKINYSKPTSAAESILHQLDEMGVTLSPRAIEEHLKKIPDALERRMK